MTDFNSALNNMKENYIKVVKNFKDFETRASVAEFWWFFLANLIISVVLSVVDGILGISLFGAIYGLVLLVPGIAVAVRRLHDINKPGLWLLVALVPLVGAIYLIYLYIQKGDEGKNDFGPAPVK